MPKSVANLKYTGWILAFSAKRCRVCTEPFHVLFRMKHHCRVCGNVVCYNCIGSAFIEGHSQAGAMKVCKVCLRRLHTQTNSISILPNLCIGVIDASFMEIIQQQRRERSEKLYLKFMKKASSVRKVSKLMRRIEETHRLKTTSPHLMSVYPHIHELREETFHIMGQQFNIRRLFLRSSSSPGGLMITPWLQFGWALACDVSQCMICGESFTIWRLKHHCRGCGNVVCQRCSGQVSQVGMLLKCGKQRVCDQCFCGQEVVRSEANAQLGRPVEDLMKVIAPGLSAIQNANTKYFLVEDKTTPFSSIVEEMCYSPEGGSTLCIVYPGLVIKTSPLSEHSLLPHRHQTYLTCPDIVINVCQHDKIPLNYGWNSIGNWMDDSQSGIETEKMFLLLSMRRDSANCLLYDVVVHPMVIETCRNEDPNESSMAMFCDRVTQKVIDNVTDYLRQVSKSEDEKWAWDHHMKSSYFHFDCDEVYIHDGHGQEDAVLPSTPGSVSLLGQRMKFSSKRVERSSVRKRPSSIALIPSAVLFFEHYQMETNLMRLPFTHRRLSEEFSPSAEKLNSAILHTQELGLHETDTNQWDAKLLERSKDLEGTFAMHIHTTRNDPGRIQMDHDTKIETSLVHEVIITVRYSREVPYMKCDLNQVLDLLPNETKPSNWLTWRLDESKVQKELITPIKQNGHTHMVVYGEVSHLEAISRKRNVYEVVINETHFHPYQFRLPIVPLLDGDSGKYLSSNNQFTSFMIQLHRESSRQYTHSLLSQIIEGINFTFHDELNDQVFVRSYTDPSGSSGSPLLRYQLLTIPERVYRPAVSTDPSLSDYFSNEVSETPHRTTTNSTSEIFEVPYRKALELKSYKQGYLVLDASHMLFLENQNLSNEEERTLHEMVLAQPKRLIGWQIHVGKLDHDVTIDDDFYNRTFVVTGIRKNLMRKTEFRLSHFFNKSDEWKLLKKNKKGEDYTILRKVIR